MSIVVTVRDDSVTEGMKRYAREKGDRLSRFFAGLQKVEIVLGTEGQSMRAEAVLSVAKGDTMAVHAVHEQMNAAIDLMLDRAQHALSKHKDRVRDHHRAAGPENAPPEREQEDESLESYQQIIDQTEFPRDES